ncbi:MAG: hypothetical protein II096_07455, partial [Erysipelotrichaceae bacterium]|nr:hypothetical protein [Erysipelotrichaceae bacterium]
MRRKRFSIVKFLIFAVIAFIVINFLLSMFKPAQQETPAVVDNTPAQPAEKPAEEKDEKNSYEGVNSLSTVYSSDWQLQSNVGKLDLAVQPGVRSKRTEILGNQKDSVTI